MPFKIENTLFTFNENSILINNCSIDYPEKVKNALVLFLQSENKVISKEQIIKSLWGSLIVSDDSLFKVIQCLRQLFNDHKLSGDILVNVYGKGYKIKPAIKSIQLNRPDEKAAEKIYQNDTVKRIHYIAIVLLALLLSITLYLNKNQNKTIISLTSFHSYKDKIKLAPKDFLLSIDNELKDSKLSRLDTVRLYSLKGFAHFNQGQYKEALFLYNQAISLNDENPTIAIADSYSIMAYINLYKGNDKKLLQYLSKSNEIYSKIENQDDGLFNTNYLNIEYLTLTHKYNQAIVAGEKLLKATRTKNNIIGELYALTSLYRAYQLLNHKNEAKKHIEMALDVALKEGNGKFISYGYGSMAVDSMNEGDFINAMKWANQTLKHAVEQPSTNDFQQGFSYIYNILSPLGHNDLAEKYLQKAINIQNHLNSEGHLHTAELNLGILKVKLNKYQEAKIIFSNLLNYNLSTLDKLTTRAWNAINQYKLQDNISAYATAKEVFYNEKSNNKIKFVAGIALMLSSFELERIKEGLSTFSALSKLANPNWLIEYKLYLDMVSHKSSNLDTAMINDLEALQKQNDQRLIDVKNNAKPNMSTLQELDSYLENILN